MLSLIFEPFQYEFIQRAVLASVIVGVLCASLGTFVVLRKMSMVGHALTHSALPGMVLAFLMKGNIFLGALGAAILTAIGIGAVSKDEAIYEDTAVGMIPTAMFALGILMISATKSYRDMSSMLFGNILGVSRGDLALIIVIAMATLVFLALFYKELKLFSVDPQYASAIGIPVDALRFALLIFLALSVGVGIQAVGAILTNALLVIPVAAARMLTERLRSMIVLSCLFSVIAALSGVYCSYYLNLSSGAAIVFSCVMIFAGAWVFKRCQGAAQTV